MIAQAAAPSRWLLSVFAALLLHAMALLLLSQWDPSTPPLERLEPIEFVFAPEPERARAKDQKFFSELPPDRVDEAPEEATALSNIDSRAADRSLEGETTSLPQQDGAATVPHVAFEPGASQPAPAGERGRSEQNSLQSDETEAQPEGRGEGEAGSPRLAGDPRELVRPPLRRTASESPVRMMDGGGAADLFQEAMDNPTGNALQFGDISLSTVAWDYAPWLLRFRRRFVRNWIAPYAYHLGIIHGEDLVELVVGPNGRLRSLELLDETGHESLGQASLAAFRSIAPLEALPDDFPEEELVLRVRLVYPERLRAPRR